MQVVCAWCADEGKPSVLLHKAPFEDPTPTHGICPDHLSAIRSEIRTRFVPQPLPEAA